MSAIFLDARYVQIELGRILVEFPELAEDDILRADFVEGETDAFAIISRALSERMEAETMVDAIKSREADMATRRVRFERKSDAMRSLIKGIMQAGDLSKLTLPEATLSISKPRVSVNVIDVNELPQGFYRTERKADKTALKQALEKGEVIPGAELSMGDETLTIRTK